MRYPALIEGGGEDYGVVFPDLPGCVAMGNTLDEAMRHAEEALYDWMACMEELGHPIAAPSALKDIEVPPDCELTTIPAPRVSTERLAARAG